MKLKRIENTQARNLSLKTKIRGFDVVGMMFLLAFVSCLCIALQEGGNASPWNSARVIGLLIGFGTLKIVFWASQWWLGENALIPIRFLRQRTVAFGSIFLFCDNMSNYMASSAG
jgi:hypothetical protein